MSFLRRLLARRQADRREIGRLAARLQSFFRPALSLVDTRELTIPAQRERYALFAYGAARALAESRGLGETEALALVVILLRAGERPRLSEQEVSHLIGRAMTLAREPAGAPAYAAGGEAMTEWLAGEAGGAVRRLAETLRA
jgi:hypothetical protein